MYTAILWMLNLHIISFMDFGNKRIWKNICVHVFSGMPRSFYIQCTYLGMSMHTMRLPNPKVTILSFFIQLRA